MARQNLGIDWQCDAMGGGVLPTNSSARQPFGTATTGPTSTTLQDTARTWNTNEWVGHVVYAGSVYGVVASNTSNTLTVDRWYNPSNPGGAVGGTPSNGVAYVIGPGRAPMRWIAMTETAGTSVTDTALQGTELNGSGWTRQLMTYAHTTGNPSYSLTATFTSADAQARTPQVAGIFDSGSGGVMGFEDAIPNPSTLSSGDTITLTQAVSV